MTTLGTLKSDVQAYLVRDDAAFVAAIPTFVRNAQARLARELIHSKLVTTTTLTISGRSADLPSDLLEIQSLTLASSSDGRRRTMNLLTSEQIRESRLWDQSGDPCNFSIEGGKVFVAPVAASTGTDFDLVYYARLPALTSDGQTNFVLTDAYDLMLNLVLAEACRFIQDDMKADQFFGAYVDARTELLKQDMDRYTRGSSAVSFGTGPKV